MLGNIGPLEIGVVLIVALIVFGPRRLPELGSSLGRGIREFRQTVSGETSENDGADRQLNPPGTSEAPASTGSETPPVEDSVETRS